MGSENFMSVEFSMKKGFINSRPDWWHMRGSRKICQRGSNFVTFFFFLWEDPYERGVLIPACGIWSGSFQYLQQMFYENIRNSCKIYCKIYLCNCNHYISISPEKQLFALTNYEFFLSLLINICFMCSKRDMYFGYPQQMFWLTYKKIN